MDSQRPVCTSRNWIEAPPKLATVPELWANSLYGEPVHLWGRGGAKHQPRCFQKLSSGWTLIVHATNRAGTPQTRYFNSFPKSRSQDFRSRFRPTSSSKPGHTPSSDGLTVLERFDGYQRLVSDLLRRLGDTYTRYTLLQWWLLSKTPQIGHAICYLRTPYGVIFNFRFFCLWHIIIKGK